MFAPPILPVHSYADALWNWLIFLFVILPVICVFCKIFVNAVFYFDNSWDDLWYYTIEPKIKKLFSKKV